jgi:hypothetical protein
MPAKNNLNKIAKSANRAAGRVLADIRHFGVVIAGPLADKYEERAEREGVDTGIVLADVLRQFSDFEAEKPILINDQERQELDMLLDNNFSTAPQLIESIRSLMTRAGVEADGDREDITLTPNQIYRLEERARMRGLSLAKFVKTLAIDAINREAGLF